MNINDLKILYRYNYWARDQVLHGAANLSHSQITARSSISFGSMLSTLTHMLNAEWIWRNRCQKKHSPKSMLLGEKITDFESLHHTWLNEEIQMRSYLRELEERELDCIVQYGQMTGQEQSNILWHILVHVVNHGTQHRAEVSSKLTEFGYSPGNIDFILFMRDRQHGSKSV